MKGKWGSSQHGFMKMKSCLTDLLQGDDQLAEERALDIVYLDSGRLLTVFYKILIDKLVKYRWDKWTASWTESCWTTRLRVLWISSKKPSWRPVTSFVPQGSILGPTLFDLVTDDQDNGAEYTLKKFADGAKLGRVAEIAGVFPALQGDQNRLEKWVDTNLKIQQMEMPSPAAGQEKPDIPVHAGAQLAGKQLCRLWLGDTGQNDHKPPRQQRWPAALWTVWGKVCSASWGRWSCPSTQHCWGHT